MGMLILNSWVWKSSDGKIDIIEFKYITFLDKRVIVYKYIFVFAKVMRPVYYRVTEDRLGIVGERQCKSRYVFGFLCYTLKHS